MTLEAILSSLEAQADRLLLDKRAYEMGKAKGEGPYHNNPHKDTPKEMKMVNPIATSVKQGKSLADELDWTPSYNKTPFPHDGLSAKIPKK